MRYRKTTTIKIRFEYNGPLSYLILWVYLWVEIPMVVFSIINQYHLAEGEGFEPPEPRGSTVFKTAAIDHSATPPQMMLPLSGGDR